MNIKPILFNTAMVRAIIEGRKTQTRRIIKCIEHLNVFHAEPDEGAYVNRAKWNFAYQTIKHGGICESCFCTAKSQFSVGDILWVRETFTKGGQQYYFRADFESYWLDACETLSGGYPIECTYHPGCEGCGRSAERIRWSPSIHMPKEAARIFLHVTGIRAERISDMTEDDAIAEGFPDMPAGNLSPLERFANIWDKTIKRDDLREFGYHADPWVWVIEFERCEKPEGWYDNWNRR